MFLLYQYIEKKTSDDYDFLTTSTIEESLKENDITYNTLPKQVNKEQYLSAKSKYFSEDDLKKLKNQKADLKDYQTIKSEFNADKRFILSEKTHTEALDAFVKDNVLYGDRYKYWGTNESNDIIYYQTYKDKMIYNNSSAKLLLRVNEKKEIVSYEQTYLEDFDDNLKEKEEVIAAIRAVETLFLKNKIQSKSEITDARLGYINVIQNDSISHVLTPTWHIEVKSKNDKKEDLFVNALDGRIIEFEDTTLFNDLHSPQD